MAMVVGRRVLGAYVLALCGGRNVSTKEKGTVGGEEGVDEGKWEEMGKVAFDGDKGEDVRRDIVEGVLGDQGMAGWCEEQVSLHI